MSIPFALSLSKYVNSAGTDVGFASLLAVALLALLYFAGARDSRTLRDQLEDAHNRITSLEARLAQVMRAQAARAAAPQSTQSTQMPSIPGRPGVVPAPSVAQPMGGAVARVRPGSAATAGAPAFAGVLLGAPAGAGAPSLGSATKLIPSPDRAPVMAPPLSVPAAVPAAATAAAAGAYAAVEDDEFLDDFEPEDTMYVPASAGMAANGFSGGGGAAVAAPPRMEFGDDDPAGPLPRRTIPTVPSGPSAPRRVAGRLIGALVALLIVAAIVVALLLITSNNGTKTKTAAVTHTATTPKKKAVAFNPASVKVSVLNGTAIGGLATDVGDELRTAGYKVPVAAVTNAAVQTESTTTVGYRSGYKTAALKVAQALQKSSGVAITSVAPATAAAVTSCATPVTGTETSCPANVIVTIGTDLSSAASSSSTSG